MLDPSAQALAAVSARSSTAVPLVFAAGVLSSLGPCAAPRCIAVAGLCAGTSRGRAVCAAFAFIAGLAATYAAFGAVSSLVARAGELSAYTYWAVAAAFTAAGCAALWRGEPECAHAHGRPPARGIGAAMLLGCSFALVVSPCCTPIVLGILAYASPAGDAVRASALLAAFAFGHALPILAIAFGTSGTARILERYTLRRAANVVAAALMLGLAGYYAVLA